MAQKLSGKFQISEKRDNLERLTKISNTNLSKISVLFDLVPEFAKILVEWIAPKWVLTHGGRSYLNASVTEKNAVPLFLPASSPALTRLALLSLARSIADCIFACTLDYPERDL